MKAEINSVKIEESNLNEINELLNKLSSLLNIRITQDNAEIMKESRISLVEFMKSTKFKRNTIKEVYLAYQMAMTGDLLDHNHKIFTMYREFNSDHFSSYMNSYNNNKKVDVNYQRKKDEIIKMNEKEYIMSDEKILSITKQTLTDEYNYLIQNGFVKNSHYMYIMLGDISEKKLSISYIHKVLAKIKNTNKDKVEKYKMHISKVHGSFVSQFNDILISEYIFNKKLYELSLSEWLDFWLSKKINK